ncbi:MAG: adenylyltransferase/cytidyltransferase family protein [Thermoplasmatales archaeon]|nr:MAG: adenylyltransferase/cytidyltransferase family protein [Thermoplasmatales archaeon]
MKIVYSYYVLDLIHKGHLLMMKNSKAMAGEDGKLIVGILTTEAVLEKKAQPPVLSFDERIDIAKSIKYVDAAIPQATYSPIPNIKNIKPDILMESDSHKAKEIEEARKVMESFGGRVVVMPYYPSQCSTNIKKKIKNEVREDQDVKISQF